MTDERELIRRAKRGDVHAYHDLVRMHERPAFRLAYVITGHREDAEDACQEAFLRAFRGLKGFRDGAAFAPWIMRITSNEARDRRAASRRAPDELDLRVAERREPSNDTVEDDVLLGDARRRLLCAWSSLAEPDRLVIACRYFLDLSEGDTAHVLELPRGTVKSRLHRALARLRLTLEGAT